MNAAPTMTCSAQELAEGPLRHAARFAGSPIHGDQGSGREAALAAIAQDPKLRGHAEAWQAIERLQPRQAELMNRGISLNVSLFQTAQTLVRMEAEDKKPSPQRLREFRDSARESLVQQLFSPAPSTKISSKRSWPTCWRSWSSNAVETIHSSSRCSPGRVPGREPPNSCREHDSTTSSSAGNLPPRAGRRWARATIR